MRWRMWALAALAALAALKGGALPEGREMEQLQLVTALAVDGTGPVTVTAVTGARASEQDQSQVLSGEGEDLEKACQALRGKSARRAYLGQAEQLLLGEGSDVAEVLEFALGYRELRLDTLLYIVRGEAGPPLAASAEKVAAEAGGEDPRGRTVGEVLPRLVEGERTAVPALRAGEDGTLEPGGWAVLGPSGLMGYTEEAGEG